MTKTEVFGPETRYKTFECALGRGETLGLTSRHSTGSYWDPRSGTQDTKVNRTTIPGYRQSTTTIVFGILESPKVVINKNTSDQTSN